MGAARPGGRHQVGYCLSKAAPRDFQLYGRQRGHRLRDQRQALYDTTYPRLAIQDGEGPLDPATLFAFPIRGLWLEIGFGGGEHLAAQAKAHPEIGLIGVEPFMNGVASLLHHVEALGLKNVRVLQGDARLLMPRLPEASVGRLFALFPDPWPKTRHQRRRIVGPATLDAMARIMTDGAELRVATDHVDYGIWILRHVRAHPAFRWTARGPADWRTRPDDWPATRYEAKAGEAGRPCIFLRFERRPRG